MGWGWRRSSCHRSWNKQQPQAVGIPSVSRRAPTIHPSMHAWEVAEEGPQPVTQGASRQGTCCVVAFFLLRRKRGHCCPPCCVEFQYKHAVHINRLTLRTCQPPLGARALLGAVSAL